MVMIGGKGVLMVLVGVYVVIDFDVKIFCCSVVVEDMKVWCVL